MAVVVVAAVVERHDLEGRRGADIRIEDVGRRVAGMGRRVGAGVRRLGRGGAEVVQELVRGDLRARAAARRPEAAVGAEEDVRDALGAARLREVARGDAADARVICAAVVVDDRLLVVAEGVRKSVVSSRYVSDAA